ncbi:MAG: FAD-dependent oxidoreductase [Dehalococcoidia bacterium]|nr:FAD-dependent oxidoreductase [Dehalococcoidia bacterium]
MTQFPNLLKPIRIGTAELRNRIIMPGMGTNLGNPDGTVSQRQIDYYAERAKGGAALIIIEVANVAANGRGGPNMIALDRDDVIPGLKTLVDAVHRHGAKVSIQPFHAGRQTHPSLTGGELVAPSPLPSPVGMVVPRELTIPEIEELVEKFGQAARRAKQAGFDVVEIHGAHGYLLCQFLSPLSNKRTDKYGGDLPNRMRFVLEITARVKELVGKDFPLTFRLSADEYVPGGLTIAETPLIAKRMQEAGVNAISVSAGNYGNMPMISAPPTMPRGFLAPAAETIKKAVSIPVIVAGRIGDPLLAESVIASGKADIIAEGRALIADPDLPNKLKEGRPEDVRMCTYCENCFDNVMAGGDMVCSVNAATGKEGESAITPAAKKKRVLVAGGGPAGMELARVATLRGHRVTLYEATNKLGGQALLAAIPPYREDMINSTNYLSTQMSKLKVDVHLGQKVTPELVAGAKPDVVVVATGAKPTIPDVPGAKQSHVVTAAGVISGAKTTGQKVVIIGAGYLGCDTALFLVKKGKQVTVVESGKRLAPDAGRISREVFTQKLREFGVNVEFQTAVQEITPEGLKVTSNGQSRLIEADTVVFATGAQPNKELASKLQGAAPEVIQIGDCHEAGRIIDAVHEGFRVGREL